MDQHDLVESFVVEQDSGTDEPVEIGAGYQSHRSSGLGAKPDYFAAGRG
jgi:hypothetical protein